MEVFGEGLIRIGIAAAVVVVVGALLALAVVAAGRAPATARPAVTLIVLCGPAAALLLVGLAIPATRTAWLSLQDESGPAGLGLQAFTGALSDDSEGSYLGNTLLWSILVPSLSTSLGLALALLMSRLRRSSMLQRLVMLPLAMAYVGACIAWGLSFGWIDSAQSWAGGLSEPWNSLLLMAVMVWVLVGFAMVILAAAIDGIPADLMEAARLDGATGWGLLTKVTLPMLRSTVLVVFVTIMAVSIKAFDVVRTLTNGGFGTQVLANEMFEQAFVIGDSARGSALAMLLLIGISPLAAYLLTRFRHERFGA